MTLKEQPLNSARWPNPDNTKWRHNYMHWPRDVRFWSPVLLRGIPTYTSCMYCTVYHGCSDRAFALGWKLHAFMMQQSCVVGGSSQNNSKKRGGLPVFFPKATSVRRQWIRFVKTTRSDFVLQRVKKGRMARIEKPVKGRNVERQNISNDPESNVTMSWWFLSTIPDQTW